MVSQERLVLKGNCLTSCKGTKFEWSVYEQGQLMPNIEDIITTPVNFSMFVLMPNVFKEHLNYTVVYTAQRESGALQISPYNIIVDELPKGGNSY